MDLVATIETLLGCVSEEMATGEILLSWKRVSTVRNNRLFSVEKYFSRKGAKAQRKR
jgi:hypothetical protein